MYVENRYNQKVKDLKENKHVTKLHYLKLVGKTAQKIVEKDTKQLNINDYKDIARQVYNKDGYILARSIKRTMETAPARQMINSELISIYNEANLSKHEIKPLLDQVKTWIIEKKDVTNGMKLIEKIEKVNSLLENSTVNVSQTQIIDYSKIGKDGQPAQKVVKTLEITKSEAIRDGISSDQTDVDSKPQPENS